MPRWHRTDRSANFQARLPAAFKRGQIRKNTPKIYGAPRFAQRDAAWDPLESFVLALFVVFDVVVVVTGRQWQVLSVSVTNMHQHRTKRNNVTKAVLFEIRDSWLRNGQGILPKDGNFGDLPSSHRKGKVEKLSFVCSAKTKKHRSNLKTTICLHIKNSKNIRVRGITNTYYRRTDISKEQ
ncbi:hypothetical protein HZH68_005292 [Vespula germanica]|uniref:Uncharacterized protein n=1 Tax=Vespula germanica TaxID=30212 RepID=A0A834KFV6_VESGE|nr:hypothetical protein HZH68_005292 [Vespula germanica]